jgi:hypothetical protein
VYADGPGTDRMDDSEWWCMRAGSCVESKERWVLVWRVASDAPSDLSSVSSGEDGAKSLGREGEGSTAMA